MANHLDGVEGVSLAYARPGDLGAQSSQRGFHFPRQEEVVPDEKGAAPVVGRITKIVRFRREMSADRMQQGCCVAGGVDEIDGRANGAMSVRAVDVEMPFSAPEPHGVEDFGDLIVVEGNKGLEHLRASRSKRQEHL